MLKRTVFALTFASLFSLASATNFWIGGPLGGASGQSGLTTATIKAVRIQKELNQALISIHQSNANVPSTRLWNLPLSTDADYAMLTTILTAYEMGTTVQFLETTAVPNTSNSQFYFTNFTAGEMN